MNKNEIFKNCWQEILKRDKILLVSHVKPDADTICSNLALFEVLKKLGKKVYFYSFDKVPQRLKFLKQVNCIKHTLPQSFDLTITCDIGSVQRLGIKKQGFLINIDHHQANELYGDLNVIFSQYPSNTSLIFDLLCANNIQITKTIATFLYCGLMEDSECFRNKISPKALNIGAKLLELKADSKAVMDNLFFSTPLSKLRITQFVLNNFKLELNASFAYAIITQENLKQCGSSKEELKNLASVLKNLASVELAALIKENENKTFDVSLRTKNLNASKIALVFGGGGHEKSAGFVSRKTKEEIIEKLKEELERSVF